MNFVLPQVGYQILTADGAVGTSGAPVALFGYAFKSGGTAGVPVFRDGTSTSGTAVFDHTGTINVTVFRDFPNGVVFPSGLFVDIDANVSTITVFYRLLRT